MLDTIITTIINCTLYYINIDKLIIQIDLSKEIFFLSHLDNAFI